MRNPWKLELLTTAVLVAGCADTPAPTPAAPEAPAAALAAASATRYAITDLGILPGGSFGQGGAIAPNGLVAGIADHPDGHEHAVLWSRGTIRDIGPAGMNSGAFGINERGQVSGLIETAGGPGDENFCGYATGRACRPFLWQNGTTTLLPLLGGRNGTIGNINARGQIPGAAETATLLGQECPSQTVNGTEPRREYLPVVWGPQPGAVRTLQLPRGDKVGMALWINDAGQAVGVAGTCDNTVPPPMVIAPHAVLWESNGTPVDLGTLGSTGDLSERGLGHAAFSINNRGQVVGFSVLADNETTHGFIWTRASGMQPLEPLPGHTVSAALGINDRGEAVGGSHDGDPFNSVAVIWRNGVAADLNDLVAGDTPLYLLHAFAINDAGQIVGIAFDMDSFEVHAFLATPAPGASAGKPAHRSLPPGARGKLQGMQRQSSRGR